MLPYFLLSWEGQRPPIYLFYLVPSGLSYYPITHKKQFPSSQSLDRNSPATEQLVRSRRGRLASGMLCTGDRYGPVTQPSLASSTTAPILPVFEGSAATWRLKSTAPS